jgi:hypothetical protein
MSEKNDMEAGGQCDEVNLPRECADGAGEQVCTEDFEWSACRYYEDLTETDDNTQGEISEEKVSASDATEMASESDEIPTTDTNSSPIVDGDTIAYPNPTVEVPPKAGKPFVAGTMFSFNKYGYKTEEYFYGGTANSYVNTSKMKKDGKWEVSPKESATYKSRMLVYRPIDPADFNGTVVMEWYNVTGGVDTAADWVVLHTEIFRRGYIYVGISAQAIGIEGGKPPLPSPIGMTLPLKKMAPNRYKSLSHPGDSFSYDIFAQAAQAIRHPKGIAPLADFKVKRLIALGESQSATRLTTFVNAFSKKTDLFDGYYIHSRLGNIPNFGGASAPLSESPQADITAPEVVIIREDIDKPVMNLQTETDLFVLGAHTCRQPDNDMFRLWEVAGTAHADIYTMKSGMVAKGEKTQANIIIIKKPNLAMKKCPDSINSAPQHHFVAKAALDALNTWLKKGTPPPSAPRIELNASGDGFKYDEFGNVLGGVRSPYVDVPVARFSGENSSEDDGKSICFLFGTTEMLDDAILKSLYSDHDAYVAAVADAAREAVDKGFLLSEDEELIVKAARASDIP